MSYLPVCVIFSLEHTFLSPPGNIGDDPTPVEALWHSAPCKTTTSLNITEDLLLPKEGGDKSARPDAFCEQNCGMRNSK